MRNPRKERDMSIQIPKTALLGDLVLTVFDNAAKYSTDPREISRLATQTISHMLWHAPRLKNSRPHYNRAS
jgi:hypothetical protein